MMIANRPAATDQIVCYGLALFLGLYGWAVFFTSFNHDGLIGPLFNAPGADYMVYYEAASSWSNDSGGRIYDGAWLTERINHDFADWLRMPLPFHPWVYPPPFRILLLPFASLRFGLSYGLFEVTTFAAAIAGAWCWARSGWERWAWLLALGLAPAAANNAVTGQNAFLTLALFLGGFGVLRRSSLLGGAILGVLCYKPQLAFLVPVALVAQRDWRALFAAALSAVGLFGLSISLFGAASWWSWAGIMLDAGPAFAEWTQYGRLWGMSAWTCATLLGASPTLARAIQWGVTGLSIILVYRTFRVRHWRARSVALLLAAALVAAPHVSPYDLMLLAAAVALSVLSFTPSEGSPPRSTLLVLAWGAGGLGVPGFGAAGFAPPLSAFALMVSLAWPLPRPKPHPGAPLEFQSIDQGPQNLR